MNHATHTAVDLAAREAYGRLVAYLAARWRDLAAVEDALGDAFAAALSTWPRDGVPRRPEAWLLTAARRRLIDAARQRDVCHAHADALVHASELLLHARQDASCPVPDERLTLLFVCAHPAIAAEARTPLMLQTVLGLDAARIARAFLVPPATLSQRLVRAKTKIRDAGLRFACPEPAEWPERLEAVVEAIYALYGFGWSEAATCDGRPADLAAEALWLARLLVDQLPEEPEARGLLALFLHCEARRPARHDAQGRFVPLSAQDPARWDAALLAEAEEHLTRAFAGARVGRFQLEAAIQSAHAARRRTGVTDWAALVTLYTGLLRFAPTLGARVNHAAVLAEAAGAGRGLAALDAIEAPGLEIYQPAWTLRAHLLRRLGRTSEAHAALDRALALTEEPAARAFLLRGVEAEPPRSADAELRTSS